jgi:SAM-dependent methyltransferase
MTAAVRLYRRLLNWIQPEYRMVGEFIQLALAPVASPLPLLDVGGGRAPYAAALRRALPDTPQFVVDLYPGDAVGVVADAGRLPIDDGKAGAVVMFQVLQHVEQPAAVLAEIRRVLAADGHLLITYPSIHPQGRSRDLWRWTRAGIETLVASAGFSVVAHRSFGGMFFLATSMMAALPGRLLIRHARRWRSGRNVGDHLRIGLAFACASPWHALGHLALLLDGLVPVEGYQAGGLLLARRAGDD